MTPIMLDFKGKIRTCRPLFVTVGGILLLLASVTLLSAALQNWGFTTATNYTFDSAKIDVSGGVAKLKPVAFIHDEEAEFSGTHSNTRWATDNIELNSTGLSSGSGTYTSQTIDSGAAGTQWGKISWTEVLNQGSANFSPTKIVGSLSTGLSVYGADVDGDDDIDVVVVQGSSPLIHYFENDGAEAFTARTVDSAKPKNPVDLHVADINKDGRRDLVVLAKGDLVWFENQGGTPPTWNRNDITPSPSTGLEVEVADVNGDGNLDVIIGDESKVQWYENNGANPPRWTVQAVDITLSAVDALSAGDLDGDGDLDLLAGDGAGLYWYENNGANPPLFTKNNIDTTIVNTESIITADLNKDGKMDVVGVGLNGLNLSWYENDGSSPPNFTKRTVDSGPLTSPVSVSAGDLDRDGNMDLVLVDGADVHWYRNGGGPLPGWAKVTLTNGTVGGGDHLFLVNLLDDINGDDDLDIVVAENNQVSWWENLLPHSSIRFQLRTSTDGTTWSSWQGPGGRTTSSYTDPAEETIVVPNGRYIQYRAFIRNHNSNSLNAQLSMVRLDPAIQSYPTDNPTVQNKTGQDYKYFSSFAEILGDGNQGVIKYQISNDGTVWYYHSGSLWVPAAQGFTHANTAAEVNTTISSFDDDVGADTFFFKAFLNSDGTQQVELDQIQIDYSTVGAPAQLVFSVQPSSALPNATISPAIKVQVQDADGNLVTTATHSVTLAMGSNPGGANVAGTLTLAPVGGEAIFNSISLDKAGSDYTLVASASGLTSATTDEFYITASSAMTSLITAVPTSIVADGVTTSAITVQLKDVNGNNLNSGSDMVALATDLGTLGSVTNNGNGTYTTTLTSATTTGTATITGTLNTVAITDTATVTLTPVVADATNQLVFTVQPSSAEANAVISPTIKVQVQDADGNLITNATDAITLAIGSSSGGVELSGTTSVGAVGGEATFSNISIDTAGSDYTLVASASGLTSATSTSFNITGGAAKKLAFSVQPSSAEANAVISPAIKVQVEDADGKLVSTTTTITLAIGSSSDGAKLAGTSSKTAVGGEATFSNISIDTAGNDYTLVASASGLTSATSTSFNITGGAAKKLAFSVQPSNAEVGVAISPAIKVQVQDAEGNLVSTAKDSIALAIGTNSGGSTLSGTLTVVAVGGEATFSGISLDKSSSDYTLVASASGLTSATSEGFGITAGHQVVGGVIPEDPDTESISITEKVTESVKLDAEVYKKTEDSKEATGATSPEKTSTPEKVAAKPTNKSKTSAKSVLEDAATAVPQVPREIAELSAEISPTLLNRETEVAAGETVTIQFRADSGLAPEIDVYDANNVQQLTAAVMTEIGNTGIYEYKLSLDTAWGSGDFTVVASESKKGSLNRMTLAVASATDTSVVQSQTNKKTSVIRSHTDTDRKLVRINPDSGTDPATIPALLTDVQTKLNTIDTYLSKAAEGVDASSNADAEAISANPQGLEIEPIQSSIREISELLKQVSSENGVNLDIMYGSIDETTGDVLELRDKVERLKVLLDLNREISEKVLEGSKKPLMKTWFESGSVILKILVVNPSQEESLTIPLKVYLPKEVSPEDIIELGDLSLDFDTEKGMYTVHNEVTLEPGQSMTKLVRMEDIWLLKEEDLSSIMDNAKDVARRLEETPYAEDAAVLFETIGKKIKAILIKQKETMGSPGEHIKAYREGITAIATIERELSKLNGRLGQEFSKGELSGESLLAEGSGLDSGEGIGPEESFAGLPPD
jgi:hypothetical protein